MKAHTACTITFIALFILFIVMILMGMMRGWNTSVNADGVSEWSFYTIYDNSRFLPEPNASNPLDQNISGRIGETAAGNWYYWKLAEPDLATRSFVWCCYAAHQISFWSILYVAQRQKEKGEGYSENVQWYNYALLSCTIFFHVLHLFQTHVSYDGLAQDVAECSSQGSVVLALILILLLEYKNRGVIFGFPENGSFGIFNISVKLARKYHGYLFAWGCIYTFWYHPMESTFGHLMGFLHTAMFMIQGSLIYTDVHKNQYWRLLIEVWVLIHGTTVALQQKQDFWAQFFAGWGFLFLFTQIHGLSWMKKVKWQIRIIPGIIFMIIVIIWYVLVPDDEGNTWRRLLSFEPIRIPIVEYIGMLLVAVMIFVFRKAFACCGGPIQSSLSIIYSVIAFIIMVIVLIVCCVIEYYHPQLALSILMNIFSFFLCIISALIIVLLDSDLKKSVKKQTK